MEKEIRPVSAQAVRLYREEMDKILFLLKQKQETAARMGHSSLLPEIQLFIQGISDLFCRTLQGIYEFGLYDRLETEYFRFLSLLLNRDMPQKCFDHLIKEWDMGVHTFVPGPEANELVRPLAQIQQDRVSVKPDSVIKDPPLPEAWQPFFKALMAKDRRESAEAIQVLCRQGVSGTAVLTDVFPGVLKKTRQLWEKNEISTVDRQLTVDICRHVLRVLTDTLPAEDRLSGRVVVAGIPGTVRDLACDIQEAVLKRLGWDVRFVGYAVQQIDLFQALLEIRPDIVFFRIEEIAGLPVSRQILEKIRELLPKTKRVLAGDAAVSAREKLLSCCDAVAQDFMDGHQKALELIK